MTQNNTDLKKTTLLNVIIKAVKGPGLLSVNCYNWTWPIIKTVSIATFCYSEITEHRISNNDLLKP